MDDVYNTLIKNIDHFGGALCDHDADLSTDLRAKMNTLKTALESMNADISASWDNLSE
jgi:hypothetical protein